VHASAGQGIGWRWVGGQSESIGEKTINYDLPEPCQMTPRPSASAVREGKGLLAANPNRFARVPRIPFSSTGVAATVERELDVARNATRNPISGGSRPASENSDSEFCKGHRSASVEITRAHPCAYLTCVA
jgi:hypothetical protein